MEAWPKSRHIAAAYAASEQSHLTSTPAGTHVAKAGAAVGIPPPQPADCTPALALEGY